MSERKYSYCRFITEQENTTGCLPNSIFSLLAAETSFTVSITHRKIFQMRPKKIWFVFPESPLVGGRESSTHRVRCESAVCSLAHSYSPATATCIFQLTFENCNFGDSKLIFLISAYVLILEKPFSDVQTQHHARPAGAPVRLFSSSSSSSSHGITGVFGSRHSETSSSIFFSLRFACFIWLRFHVRCSSYHNPHHLSGPGSGTRNTLYCDPQWLVDQSTSSRRQTAERSFLSSSTLVQVK